MFHSRVADETHRLEPLYDVDNEIIKDFPQTSSDINRFNGKLDSYQKHIRLNLIDVCFYSQTSLLARFWDYGYNSILKTSISA